MSSSTERICVNSQASPPAKPPLPAALDLAAEIVEQYELAAVSALLDAARAAASQDEITVAVLGRFKAGKSSFLNDLAARGETAGPLPVGVVPVTSVVTEIRYGPRERAAVRFHNGGEIEISPGEIGQYVSEKENPRNARQAALVTLELPGLRRFRGLKFADTPGLESALAHNTQAALDWLPNAGFALVAMSADPPLSARDLKLIQSLHRYTPQIGILLTKADLLDENELREVVEFVRAQLALRLPRTPPIFPYSTRPGFGALRGTVETALLGLLGDFAPAREAIVSRKIGTLLDECSAYLTLSLNAAGRIESERRALQRQLAGEKEALDDLKSQIRLVIRDAAGRARAITERHLDAHRAALEADLVREFDGEFPKWTKNLAVMLESFENWLAASLRARLGDLSAHERGALLAPLASVSQQAYRALQQFRGRLSESVMRAFGAPLRTTETEIAVREPAAPDVRIGRVFDRNWELLSPILPAFLIRGAVRRHFRKTASYLVYQNLSRLAAQWEEAIHGALDAVEREAGLRAAELIATVERAIERGATETAPRIGADLERLRQARKVLVGEES